jgi:hypothetical protein
MNIPGQYAQAAVAFGDILLVLEGSGLFHRRVFVNRAWHREHKMPEGAKAKERIGWHLEHTRNCACRPFPKGLMAQLSDEQRQQVADGVERPAVASD